MNTLINVNRSFLGKDIKNKVEEILKDETHTDYSLAEELHEKYLKESEEYTPIVDQVHYYVNYNNLKNPEVNNLYLIRDKLKSPRVLPDSIKTLDPFNSGMSHEGRTLKKWAYYQASNSSNEYYKEAVQLIADFFDAERVINLNRKYFVKKKQGNPCLIRDRSDEETTTPAE